MMVKNSMGLTLLLDLTVTLLLGPGEEVLIPETEM